MALLIQRVVPAVSTSNLEVNYDDIFNFNNSFLRFVESVITTFVIYSIFIGVCLFLLQSLLQLR